MTPNIMQKTENFVKNQSAKKVKPKPQASNKLPPKSLSMLHKDPTNLPSKKFINESTTNCNEQRPDRGSSFNKKKNSSMSRLSVTSKSPINSRQKSIGDYSSNAHNRIDQREV